MFKKEGQREKSEGKKRKSFQREWASRAQHWPLLLVGPVLTYVEGRPVSSPRAITLAVMASFAHGPLSKH